MKGVRRIGVRLGNWLAPEQGRRLLHREAPSNPVRCGTTRWVAMLIGCGLRRAELLVISKESRVGGEALETAYELEPLITAGRARQVAKRQQA